MSFPLAEYCYRSFTLDQKLKDKRYDDYTNKSTFRKHFRSELQHLQ